MSVITGSLFLPQDVYLTPVADLPEETRRRFSHSDGDMALTRQQSRVPTKIVSADSASLLEQFRSPKTVVEAILHYSVAHAIDPHSLLQNVYPFIQQMVQTNLLVPADTAVQDVEPLLERGDKIDEFTIVRPLQRLQDTDLYQAVDPEGNRVAIKLVRPEVGPAIAQALTHEAHVLNYLREDFTPDLVRSGCVNGRPYLALSWCVGVDAASAAASARIGPDAAARRELLRLCAAILKSYAALHAQNVLHGDIHPGNILIDNEGNANLIDFGLAAVIDPKMPAGPPFRGGVSFFYEPEYANAFLRGDAPPELTLNGEQYALAALIYQLLTGHHYLDFSLEQETMMRQIAENPPLPFAHHGLPAWPEAEALLHKALSKNPAARFSDIAGFAAAFGNILSLEMTASLPRAYLPSAAVRGFIDEALSIVGWDSSLLNQGLPRAPLASVNFGAAGIAHTLYLAACRRSDPRLLALANIWLVRAEAAIHDKEAFYNPELDISAETVGNISPFHTAAGVHLTRIKIAEAMGDKTAEWGALLRFVQAANDPCPLIDVGCGRAGVLLNSALLIDNLTDKTWAEESGLLALGNQLMVGMWAEIDQYAPVGSQSGLTNLGAAHGWAGLLYATIKWCLATNALPPSLLRERLTQLANQAEWVGRGVRWPWDLQEVDASMPGWCNGSAGHIYLWNAAYRFFDDEQYLDLAVRAGWHCWESPPQVANLCCGLAGRGYALLNLFQITADHHWLSRAAHLAELAVRSAKQGFGPEYVGLEHSLFKGKMGIASLLIDLERPIEAALPFFG